MINSAQIVNNSEVEKPWCEADTGIALLDNQHLRNSESRRAAHLPGVETGSEQAQQTQGTLRVGFTWFCSFFFDHPG